MLRPSRPLALIPAILLLSPTAWAVTPRVKVVQHGDFVLIGNTLAQDCNTPTPNPIVGTKGGCGTNVADAGADVYWHSEDPGPGAALASTSISSPTQARSTAILSLPTGAAVTHAYLYWAATVPMPAADTTVTLERPGGFSNGLVAVDQNTVAGLFDAYQSVVDVTSLVQTNGPGAYRVTGVDATLLVNANDQNAFMGWWMVVVYALPSDPMRAINVYDGLDAVTGTGLQASTTLDGFKVPSMPTASHLGVIGFSGDKTTSGDQLKIGGTPFGDALSPASNFFNGTHSKSGLPVSTAGDLPQTTGAPASMSGLDLDTIDISPNISPLATSLTVVGVSTNDNYLVGGLVTSIPSLLANLSATLSVSDDNGGAVVPGDTLTYTLAVTNVGDDTAANVRADLVIPSGATYVADSLVITSGVLSGAKTDTVGDDQGEFQGASPKVSFLLGAGATGTTGGTLTSGEITTATFQVQVAGSIGSNLSIQGSVGYTSVGAQLGTSTSTDGDMSASGNQPTTVLIEECADNTPCSGATPVCKTTDTPRVCVGCVSNTDCAGNEQCDTEENLCFCVPTAEVCDGLDNDCNGQVDNGVMTGGPCTAGLGVCASPGTFSCAGPNGYVCGAEQGIPTAEICGNGLDDDCDGEVDNGCNLDSDGDGLTDTVENGLGTDPHDADSDDDGVPDGQEIDPAADTDGDTQINALDNDSDGDGIFDGTELGRDCSGPGTDATAGRCIPDADSGETKTSMVDHDTDHGGVDDGVEDANHDGKVDPGEKDPTNPEDDGGCTTDSDCGASDSGRVCDVASGFACVDGCRAIGGNSCPSGQICSSEDASIGTCSSGTGGMAGSGGGSGSGGTAGTTSFDFPDLWGLGNQAGGAAGGFAAASGASGASGASTGRPSVTPVTPTSSQDPDGCTVSRGVLPSSSGRVAGLAALVGLLGLTGRRRRRSA